ncbi:MAG: hypothetical protein Q8R98_07810 [Rubrivivax sp.]|nr:hypothetical protein [Rubrivivax sp.]MDZ4054377.1 hypothetical protein [Phenylobacterium sp.]MDZ4321867.1 hypothetical protein [Phenylobacterium sp.]
MSNYTLVTTTTDGQQHTTSTDFPDDEAIIQSVRDQVSEKYVSIAIARGLGDEVDWMGVWDWNEGSPTWAPDT